MAPPRAMSHHGRDLDAAYWRVIDTTERDPEGCLLSGYSVGSHGYAQAWDGTTVVLAHRIVWEWNLGTIPAGMTVDHECHMRICVDIEHLRLLPNAVNAADNGQVKTNPDSYRRCGKGHVMAMGTVNGKAAHYCRTCQNERRRARRALGKAN